MIAQLRGTVQDRTEGAVVLDVAGVGYLVHVPAGFPVPARGRELTVHTSLQVREDSMTLYGFATRQELRLFELLLTSSGVGPKLAMAALSALRPAVIEAALASGDVATLTSVPGIGRKVADRLVLELKDRIGPLDGLALSGSAGPDTDTDVLAEVREALAGFGFTPTEVRAALAGLERVEDESSGALLRRALQALGRGAEVGR
jgi:holliday junction DNA helicase RuvA